MNLKYFAHLCGYSAIVAIDVFIIKQPSNTRRVKNCLKSAERCQEQMELSRDVESFARRCTSVLDRLHIEVIAKQDERTQRPKRQQRPEQNEQRQEQSEWYATGNNIGVVDRLYGWSFSDFAEF
ncbi:hypothetical protein NA56DRAFT_708782 [Hyaloscypha hepaticicola]|uniref:Uncharacterized protein n=1 Tax=Hyaloscypha hepaticicola TaxID=2082293 RepID=A0A2J6PRJ4_9HELO|nr:hypothetical protein NA56DRAFT_708782 [Hyaloscypha hepaticicola]